MTTAKHGGLRVVLDSNVYVSAFTHPQGLSFWIWRQALRRRYRLLISPAIVNEVGGVLRAKFVWDDLHIISRLKLLAKAAEIVIPTANLKEIEEDDDDNRILECAIAGHTNLIVSSDRHLRRLKVFQGIGIVHPIDFRRTLGE
jgi:uncharacterized protein